MKDVLARLMALAAYRAILQTNASAVDLAAMAAILRSIPTVEMRPSKCCRLSDVLPRNASVSFGTTTRSSSTTEVRLDEERPKLSLGADWSQMLLAESLTDP